MARKDIFGRRQQEVGGVITSDNLKGVLSVGNESWVGVLIQNFSASYQQQDAPFYELGSNNVYRMVGRPEGVMTIGRIAGFNVGTIPLEDALLDVCNRSGTMTLSAQYGECEGVTGGFNLTIGGLRGNAYQIAANAQQLITTENLRFSFSYLARGL